MSKKRIFTQEESDFIIKEYQSGANLSDLRKKLKCKSRKISSFLKENNIEIRDRYWFQKNMKGQSAAHGNINSLSKEDFTNIVKKYNSGKKLRELAGEYHISIPSLKKILIKNNIVIKTTEHNEESKHLIMEIWKNSSFSKQEIEDRLNITSKTLNKIIYGHAKNIKLKTEDEILLLINKFIDLNKLNRRVEEHQEIKNKTINLYKNSTLYLFEIAKDLNISVDLVRKFTRGIKRLNPTPKTSGEKYFYKKWLIEEGEEQANIKLKNLKETQKNNSLGKNNPMFGVPSPKGSGVGWKGWYKGFYFRSLREVAYMIYLDEHNIVWQLAEKKKYIIKYINWDGAERTYRPDFIINNEKLVEIKPKKLHQTPNIIAKTKAALIWAAENNLKYEIIDFEINYDKILNALNSGLLKFDRDYKERFLNYVKKASP